MKKNDRGAGRKPYPKEKVLSSNLNIRLTEEEKEKVGLKIKEIGKTARQVILESLGLY